MEASSLYKPNKIRRWKQIQSEAVGKRIQLENYPQIEVGMLESMVSADD